MTWKVSAHGRKSHGKSGRTAKGRPSVHARKSGDKVPKMPDPWKHKAIARRTGRAR